MSEQSLLFRIAWICGAMESDPEAKVEPIVDHGMTREEWIEETFLRR